MTEGIPMRQWGTCPICEKRFRSHSIIQFTCSISCGRKRALGRHYGNSPWTDDKIAILIERSALGWSARQIADELGVSRNAVIGRWYRNRTERPVKPKALPRPKKPKAERKPIVYVRSETNVFGRSKAQAPELLPAPIVTDQFIPIWQRRTILTLSGDCCKFMVGDPKDPNHFYCGAPVYERSFCESHYHRCYEWTKPVNMRLAA